ncbi:MAG: hypothetical protein NTW19_17740 [Planctomycetota bacterium]|nr:hypothetical protein [Planctomycetota bacterium]
MKKIIATTTINPPTEAIRRFEAMPDWELVVAGDRKTPADYALKRGTYLTPEMQEQYDPELSEVIGWNSIQRRNFAMLWAYDRGADVIAVVDDDNIPYDHWGRNLLIGQSVEANYYETDLPAFDPVGATNHPHLWHRGYPLQLIPKRDYSKRSRKRVQVDVQADFWDGDPDIDAVCRMIHAPICKFDPACFPIASNRISPFNSQNTFISRAALRNYFLFPFVGRMDDIWGAYYAQAMGVKVVYTAASVRQDRNEHDLLVDLRKEYIGYENALSMVKDLAIDPRRMFSYLPGRAIRAMELYARHFTTT